MSEAGWSVAHLMSDLEMREMRLPMNSDILAVTSEGGSGSRGSRRGVVVSRKVDVRVCDAQSLQLSKREAVCQEITRRSTSLPTEAVICFRMPRGIHSSKMAAEQQEAVADLDRSYLFNQLDEYPWASDQEFQGGLRAILGSVQDPSQISHLTLRAKCYYYARKAGTHVDFDGYKRWVETQSLGTNGATNGQHAVDPVPDLAGDGGIGDAPRPASFAEICDMIAEGKPIPGIKDIPDTVLEGQASESQAGRRRKPWERAQEPQGTQSKPSWMAA